MDKYDKMLMLFYKGDKWKGHPPQVVKGVLMELDKTVIEMTSVGWIL